MNSKTNDLVLLFDYLKVLKLFPVATDGKGLKLEKIGQFFQVSMLRNQKILKEFIMASLL